MFKFIKKLFGKKEVPAVVPTKPGPTHCTIHSRYMKSCSSCNIIVQRGY
jgi:hypothetical protein